ncbi:MAG TPA: hypothetical protein VLA98_05250, partial [Solirubrobacteraceae bacterium]|nr:hypothetical protein [Solirubrobacteraceae bacterium]
MTLRWRIGAAAGLAVAVAVLSAAAIVYVAVRAELRGGLDADLRSRAGELVARPLLRMGPGLGDHGPSARELLRPDPGRGRFGGAEGYAQLLTPGGLVVRPPLASGSIPVQDRAREVAAAGAGSYLADLTVDGTHVRVLTQALPGGGALQVARPLG